MSTFKSVIRSDGWRGYHGLCHALPRVHHGANVFARGARHINGIESFWAVAKLRFAKFKGIPQHTFYLHLKECEFRFNHRHGTLYLETLRILRNNPF